MIEHPLSMIDSDEASNDDEHGQNSLAVRSSTSPMQPQSTRLLTILRDTSPTSQTSLSSIDRRSSPGLPVELDSQTISLANIIRSKCQAKRMAPKAPNLALNQSTTANTGVINSNEFLIPVEMVRWFFKTEKEKHHASHQEQPATVSSAITLAAGSSSLAATTNDSVKSSNGSLVDTPIDSNNNPSTIGNKITVV